MKTNGLATPVHPGRKINPTRRTEKPAVKQQISDRAFYLIALATLLQETAQPGALQELLAPAKQNGAKLSVHH